MLTQNKYGCHNKPRRDAYWVQDGWVKHTDERGVRIEARRMKLHADTMSRECRYDERGKDLRCEGCERK